MSNFLNLPEHEIVQLLASGDENAWSDFCAEILPRAKAQVRQKYGAGSDQVFEDILQQAIVVLWTGLSNGQRPNSLIRYFFGIIRNLSKRAVGKEVARKEEPLPGLNSEAPAAVNRPVSLAASDEDSKILRRRCRDLIERLLAKHYLGLKEEGPSRGILPSRFLLVAEVWLRGRGDEISLIRETLNLSPVEATRLREKAREEFGSALAPTSIPSTDRIDFLKEGWADKLGACPLALPQEGEVHFSQRTDFRRLVVLHRAIGCEVCSSCAPLSQAQESVANVAIRNSIAG
jgi:DNA-directed RNA polymerase specialized sigma24 family protein